MAVQQYDSKLAQEVAQELAEIGAIKINNKEPFTWASGWKSPIYCDNRLSLSYPKTRSLVKDSLIKMIKEKYPEVEIIAGVATAGIPQGVLVAEALELPFVYVRSKTKTHGMNNQIEGVIKPDAKVVLIEDLVSTGGSSLQAANAIRSAGMEVIGMAAIFTYGFQLSVENFQDNHVDLWYLSDYNTLINSMIEKGEIEEDQKATLQSWRSNPAQWNQ